MQNYELHRCNRETKRVGGCHVYALVTLTINKVEDIVLNSLLESAWTSINTLIDGPLLGCMYRAPDSSDNVNDFIINTIIHASALNYDAKAITGIFN